MCFSHVFSPTVACLTYHSLDIFFCGAEVLILMKSGLSIISSMSCVFFCFHLKVIPKVINIFFLCYQLGVFQLNILHLRLWFFVKGLRSVSIFIFWTCSWIICWRDYLHLIVLPLLLHRRCFLYSWGLFLGSILCSIDLFFYFITDSRLSWLP